MDDITALKAENQNLLEIIEVAKQITGVLEIDYIIKNAGFVINAKMESSFFSIILPTDIDDETPCAYYYEDTKKKEWELGFPSISPIIDYFEKQEYNQIAFSYFKEEFPDTRIIRDFSIKDPDFIIPLRSDKGVIGIFIQGKKKSGQPHTQENVVYAVNLISFVSIAIDNANLYRKATVDRMTKLFTHHQFEKRLEEEISKGRRYGNIFSLIMFDIDHFKKFNDTYGHLQGDVIIKEIARLLLEFIRDVDFAARYGGEEFAVILPETDIKNAVHVAERLRRKIEDFDFPGEGQKLKVTVSMGVSQFTSGSIDFIEQLIELADHALYSSKKAGRNRVSMASPGKTIQTFSPDSLD